MPANQDAFGIAGKGLPALHLSIHRLSRLKVMTSQVGQMPRSFTGGFFGVSGVNGLTSVACGIDETC